MKTNSKTSTLGTGQALSHSVMRDLAALCILIAGNLVLADTSAFPVVDPKVLDLEINVRDTSLLEGEKIQFEVVLRNAGSEPIPMAIPSEERGLRWIAGCQLFLEPIWADSSHISGIANLSQEYYARSLPARVEQAPWPPLEVYENRKPESLKWLLPGHEVSIPASRINTTIFVLESRLYLEGIKASWLTGASRWVDSEMVPLSVQKWNPYKDGEIVFEKKWRQFEIEERTTRILRVSTQEGTYLFARTGGLTRLLEIQNDERYVVEIQDEIPQMVISFPESNRASVYFHLDEGIVGDAPWERGGNTQFTPAPRPIPPAQLQALRSRLGLNPDGTIPKNDKTFDSNTKTGSVCAVQSEANSQVYSHGGFWPWIIVCCLILITVFFFSVSHIQIFPRQ